MHKRLFLYGLMMASPVMAHAGRADATPPAASSAQSSAKPAAQQATWAKARALLSSEGGQWVALTTWMNLLYLITGEKDAKSKEGEVSIIQAIYPLTLRPFSMTLGKRGDQAFWCMAFGGFVLLWYAFYKEIAAWLLVVRDEVDGDKKVGWGKWLGLVMASGLAVVCSLNLIGCGGRVFYAWKFPGYTFNLSQIMVLFCATITDGWLLMQLGRKLFHTCPKGGHTMDGTG